MDDTATEIIEMVLRLLAGSGIVSVPVLILAVVVVAVLVVLAPKAGRRVAAWARALKVKPQEVVDEGGVQPPGVDLPTDPENPGGDNGSNG